MFFSLAFGRRLFGGTTSEFGFNCIASTASKTKDDPPPPTRFDCTSRERPGGNDASMTTVLLTYRPGQAGVLERDRRTRERLRFNLLVASRREPTQNVEHRKRRAGM
jgi:hypothetical protein